MGHRLWLLVVMNRYKYKRRIFTEDGTLKLFFSGKKLTSIYNTVTKFEIKKFKNSMMKYLLVKVHMINLHRHLHL